MNIGVPLYLIIAIILYVKLIKDKPRLTFDNTVEEFFRRAFLYILCFTPMLNIVTAICGLIIMYNNDEFDVPLRDFFNKKT